MVGFFISPSLGVLATRRLGIFNLKHHIWKLKSRSLSDALIQLVSYQNQNAVEINPNHEDNQTSNRTIKKVVCRNIRDIEIERHRSYDEQTGKQKRAWSNELEPLAARITEMIKQRHRDYQSKDNYQPTDKVYNKDCKSAIEMHLYKEYRKQSLPHRNQNY